MKTTEIFVGLIGEGTQVWRPVKAKQVGIDTFEILGIVPAGEEWEFPPGSHVKCEQYRFQDGSIRMRALGLKTLP